jgi:hypothetical protein
MPYLLDSNAFIQAKNHFYRFSFCPGFWDWVLAHHGAGSIFSVEKVEDELKLVADQLADWVTNTAPNGFFVRPTAQVATAQGVVSRWVQAQAVYSTAEKARFLAKADPWLVAEAIEGGFEIITFEEMVPPNSSKVKIPNVAANFGVNCVSLYDVIEASGAQLRT